jgi:RNA polymerase sigma factor (sigma-70 family)
MIMAPEQIVISEVADDATLSPAGGDGSASPPAHPIPRPRSGAGQPDAPAAASSSRSGDLVGKAAAAFSDYRAGVPGAIDRLVRLVTPLLWHTARHCGLGAAEAEDAVQQAFLTLVRRSDSIADPMAVVRWLTVTLRRQAWRDRAASALRTSAEPTDDDLPLAPSAESVAMLTDEQRTLWEHVTMLSPRCRRLIAVIAFSPRPDYAAIAADLGMPVGSIGPTRGRCLAKLRSLLLGEESSS